MKPSTFAELCGFAGLSYATWRIDQTAGIFVASICLLLIGYAFEDQAAAVAVARILGPLKNRRARWSRRRQNRRFRRTARQRERRHLLRRQPPEVLVRVKTE